MNRTTKGTRPVYLSELYKSIQGEGLLTGVESIFVRTSGCNLRCWFCDTPYTSWEPEGIHTSVAEIVDQCAQYQCRNVVITGGEPMLQPDIVPLTQCFDQLNCHITIETAGTIYRPVKCDLMSVSPKLANSTPSTQRAGRWASRHEAIRQQTEVVRKLIAQFEYQLKFVIDSPQETDEVLTYLTNFPEVSRQRVLLMPQGTNLEELSRHEDWIKNFCVQQGMVFCPRKQIEWFGHTRGT